MTIRTENASEVTAGASADTTLRATPRAACGSIGGSEPPGTPVTVPHRACAWSIQSWTCAESSTRRKPTAAIEATTATAITTRMRMKPPTVTISAAHGGRPWSSSQNCARRATIEARAEKASSANRPPASAIPTVTMTTAAATNSGPRSSRTPLPAAGRSMSAMLRGRARAQRGSGARLMPRPDAARTTAPRRGSRPASRSGGSATARRPRARPPRAASRSRPRTRRRA